MCLRCAAWRRRFIDDIRTLAYVSQSRIWRGGEVSRGDLEAADSFPSLWFSFSRAPGWATVINEAH